MVQFFLFQAGFDVFVWSMGFFVAAAAFPFSGKRDLHKPPSMSRKAVERFPDPSSGFHNLPPSLDRYAFITTHFSGCFPHCMWEWRQYGCNGGRMVGHKWSKPQPTRPILSPPRSCTVEDTSIRTRRWSEPPMFSAYVWALAFPSVPTIKSIMFPESCVGLSSFKTTSPAASINASIFQSDDDCLQCGHTHDTSWATQWVRCTFPSQRSKKSDCGFATCNAPSSCKTLLHVCVSPPGAA